LSVALASLSNHKGKEAVNVLYAVGVGLSTRSLGKNLRQQGGAVEPGKVIDVTGQTKKMRCSLCGGKPHSQDKIYGKGMRLHNFGERNEWKCTVCGNVVK